MASSCAVGIAGWPYHTKQLGWTVDGGVTDLDLIKAILLGTKFCKFHNGQVTSVCPFYWSRADIRPSQFVNPLWALFPPPRENLMSLYRYVLHNCIGAACMYLVVCCLLDAVRHVVARKLLTRYALLGLYDGTFAVLTWLSAICKCVQAWI